MKKVACVGILVADIIVEPVDSYPEKGALVKVNSITVHNGGNAMTAAINLRKLGVGSAIAGMVGNDMFGTYLKKKLIDEGVDVCQLKTSENVQTSASVLMIDEKGERSFFHCVGTNGVFSEQDIDINAFDDYDIVFVTGSFLLNNFDGEGTEIFLKKCKEKGKTTFLDVCHDCKNRWGLVLDECMPYIDYFMPSIDEAKCIAKKENIDDIANVFMSKGVKNVVIKLGGEGSFLRKEGDKKGKIFSPFYVENPVDTTGAGDSFCSGFLAAYAMGKSIEECMVFANAAGAQCVTQKGATSWVKSFEDTEKFIEVKKG